MKNWYEKYQDNSFNLTVEAGMKENVLSGILAAIVMVLSGATIQNAARKMNLNPSQVENAMENPEIKEKATQMINTMNLDGIKSIEEGTYISETSEFSEDIPAPVSFDEIVELIIRHEGLLPGQTPFRITNKAMENWNTIHGFPIDKNVNKPPNRRNFIFLENPDHVFPAVKRQFLNYARNPERFQNLPENPTLEQAIRVFDQTGADGKIRFLKQRIPELNLNTPLNDLI